LKERSTIPHAHGLAPPYDSIKVERLKDLNIFPEIPKYSDSNGRLAFPSSLRSRSLSPCDSSDYNRSASSTCARVHPVVGPPVLGQTIDRMMSYSARAGERTEWARGKTLLRTMSNSSSLHTRPDSDIPMPPDARLNDLLHRVLWGEKALMTYLNEMEQWPGG